LLTNQNTHTSLLKSPLNCQNPLVNI
jgi:hypothetical protein